MVYPISQCLKAKPTFSFIPVSLFLIYLVFLSSLCLIHFPFIFSLFLILSSRKACHFFPLPHSSVSGDYPLRETSTFVSPKFSSLIMLTKAKHSNYRETDMVLWDSKALTMSETMFCPPSKPPCPYIHNLRF